MKERMMDEMKKNNTGVIVGLVTVIALLCVIVGGGFLFTLSQPVSIGVTGYAANITVSGFMVQQAANAYVQQHNQQLYVLSGQPTGTEICEGDIQGYHYIVRDTGMLMLVGNAICSQIQKSGSLFQDTPVQQSAPQNNTTPHISVTTNAIKPLTPEQMPNFTP
jgi:hypothetical protein